MSNKKVKLGEKAASFYCPMSQFKVLPKQTLELTDEAAASKKVIKALKQGHLEISEDAVTKPEVQVKKDESGSEVFNPADVELTEEGMKKLKKPALVTLALYNKAYYLDDNEQEVAYTQEELETLTAKEIKEMLLEDEE